MAVSEIDFKVNNLVTRAISGGIFVGVVIVSVLLKNSVFFGAVFMLMCVLGMREFYKLCRLKPNVEPAYVLAIAGGLAAYLCAYFCCVVINRPVEWLDWLHNLSGAGNPFTILAFYLPFVVAQLVVELYRQKAEPIVNIAVALMGHLYVAVPFCCMCAIEGMGQVYLLSFFVMIWASDTGAYLVGMCIGKHKMFERISPKKTWEGFCGGLAFALVFGGLFSKFSYVFPDVNVELKTWQWFAFAVVVFITGTLGDLVESLFKRHLGIKDSGKFLPGHGGVLDRLDSALLAAPVALSFLSIVLYLNGKA